MVLCLRDLKELVTQEYKRTLLTRNAFEKKSNNKQYDSYVFFFLIKKIRFSEYVNSFGHIGE